MSDRDRLAADLHERNDHLGPVCDGCNAMADHLIALGWTRANKVTAVPVYCTGGCDECRDFARKKGVPFVHGDIVEYPEPPLDEERLARALMLNLDVDPCEGITWGTPDSANELAAAIAKAYREDEAD